MARRGSRSGRERTRLTGSGPASPFEHRGPQGDNETAVAAAEEALSVFRERGEVAYAIDCLNSLGAAALRSGDLGKARRCLEEAGQLRALVG